MYPPPLPLFIYIEECKSEDAVKKSQYFPGNKLYLISNIRTTNLSRQVNRKYLNFMTNNRENMGGGRRDSSEIHISTIGDMNKYYNEFECTYVQYCT